MKKTELYAKLSSKEFDKLTREEIDYLKNKISNDKLGLKLDFTEMDKEDLENYFVLREEESLGINVKKDQPNNLLIEGDNYHALKALKAAGVRVDIIYIDPPYNTGKEFVYKDDFGTPQTVGSDDPHKHSKWLSFMKKRLDLAKELLSDEGVIFVSIDDNEQAYLKVLMDEIFGEENFVANMPRVTRKGGKTDSFVVSEMDYLLIYGRDKENLVFGDVVHEGTNYKYADEHVQVRGKFQTKPLDVSSLSYSKNMDFIIEDESGNKYYAGGYETFLRREKGVTNSKDWTWRWSKEKLNFALQNGFAFFKDGKVQTKIYENKTISMSKPYKIIDKELTQKIGGLAFAGDNSVSNFASKKELDDIFGIKTFEYAKPVSLIKKIISLFPKKDAIVLDFFAGSGTTGQAVLEQNSIDEGERRFILVTINEMTGVDTKINPEKGIARAITRERIFRVIKEKGSNEETIAWTLGGKLKNNSLSYLVAEKIHKVNGEYESIDSKVNLYKREFNKEISIEDFE